MSPWLIYFILQADRISNAIVGLVVVASITAICGLVMYAMGKWEVEEVPIRLGKTILKICLPLLILCVPLSAMMPSTRTLAAMYLAPKIIESPVVQKDIPELYGLALDSLKEHLKSHPDAAEKASDK